jgi:hypothetical protein
MPRSTPPPVGQRTLLAEARALRPQLEQRRLDLRALLRALDQLGLAQDLPAELQDLFELDADLAEALCVLDHPPAGLRWDAMLDDTRASLARLDDATADFLQTLTSARAHRCTARAAELRATLTIADAYFDIPGGPPPRR